MPNNSTQLTIMTVSGLDKDIAPNKSLMFKKGSEHYLNNDCISQVNGSNQTCTINSPSEGRWLITFTAPETQLNGDITVSSIIE
ncbi:MAG: hypothetical protein ACJA0H_000838 [Francisellaceae bacterium]